MKRAIPFLTLFLLLFEMLALGVKQYGTITDSTLVEFSFSSFNSGHQNQLIHPSGTSLKTRISPPDGFSRTKEKHQVFCSLP